MIEFGKTLRAAREAKGLRIKDVAQATNLLVQHIDSLENEDFSRIAAPIYGRGFVKLYCEAVGLDPKPLLNAFMDIYSGNRPPAIKVKEPVRVAQKPEPVAAPPPAPPGIEETIAPPKPAPAKEERETQEPDDMLFRLESETVAPQKLPDPPTTPRISPFSSTEAPPAPADLQKPPSRYTTPKPIEQDDSEPFSIPPIVWRTGLVAGALTLAIVLAVAGIKAIYNVSMTTGQPEASVIAAAELPAADGENPPPPAKRTPMKIKPLFID